MKAYRVLGLVATIALASCAHDFDTERVPPERGSVGEELFGVVCDRIGAQTFREDLTGASFRNVCHKDAGGQFADAVDESKLPQPTAGAVDKNGQAVPLDLQEQDRAYALARMNALIRRRAELIEALDFVFPDVDVPVRDLSNPRPEDTCSSSGQVRALGREFADMLGRFGPMYKDDTVAHQTRSLARVFAALTESKEAQDTLARFASRQGYRPIKTALGAARPLASYPRLRELSAETIRVLSPDSDPYAVDPARDREGRRVRVPGAGYAPLTKLLEVSYQELRTAEPDPPLVPLAVVRDAVSGRDVISRPRTTIEALQKVMFAEDPAFGAGGPPAYIVRRGPRGYAMVQASASGVPTPFVDSNGDGLADLDDFGRFVTTTGTPPPAPFFTPDAPDTSSRDEFGRAQGSSGLLYTYLDTRHTFAAQSFIDLRPLVDPDPTHNHETLINATAGLPVLLGKRTDPAKTVKLYAPDPSLADKWKRTHADDDPPPADITTRAAPVYYKGFDAKDSAALDLIYGVSQLLADPSTDEALALSAKLLQDNPDVVARLVGAGLVWKRMADEHPEAKLAKPQSTFWDEMIDVTVEIAKEPGLLEDLMRSLAAPESAGLGRPYSAYWRNKDHISYARDNINGPAFNLTSNDYRDMHTPVDRTQPDTGWNRSAFQRFLQAVHDTNGVTVCNKDGAKVHAELGPLSVTMPPVGSYSECSILKMDNVAAFFTRSMVGKAEMYLRDDTLRNGIVGIGAATVGLIEQSSGVAGFWDDSSSRTLRPKPEYLNRLTNFDVINDSPNPGDKNYKTNQFVRDLMGDHIPTSHCAERSIVDPKPNAKDAHPDGRVYGLRTCQDGQWLDQLDKDATFVWEQFGFFQSMTPMVNAFVSHGREDLFIQQMEVMHKHWQSDRGSPSECDPSNPSGIRYCSQSHLSSYEPFLVEAFLTDIIPALHEATKALGGIKIQRCTALDPNTKQCTASSEIDGIQVLAEATRAAVDPTRAKARGLVDRNGELFSVRNDGARNDQVTPIYLITGALAHADRAFEEYAQAHPEDAARQAAWRLARSQLVDQFLGVAGSGDQARWMSPTLPKITPVLVDMLRAQMHAHCPSTYQPPYADCPWARVELTKNAEEKFTGPAFAATIDLMDAIRQDEGARRELEGLLQYLLDATTADDSLASLLASAADSIQIMNDDTDLVPIYHLLAEAAALPLRDTEGHVIEPGVVDAQLALLARIASRAFDKNGNETCNREIDPNGVLQIGLRNLVTPMTKGGQTGRTPLEVILDVVADVNRSNPDDTGRLGPGDYSNIATEVNDFLINKESGLEQLYAVLKTGVE